MPERWRFHHLVLVAVFLQYATGHISKDEVLASLSQLRRECVAIQSVGTAQLASLLAGSSGGGAGGGGRDDGADGAAAVKAACRYLTHSDNLLQEVPLESLASEQIYDDMDYDDADEERRLLADWATDRDNYYFPFIMIQLGVIAVLVFFFEAVVLSSTLLGARCKMRVANMEHAVETRAAALCEEVLSSEPPSKSMDKAAPEPPKATHHPWNDDQLQGFWAAVKSHLEQHLSPAAQQERDLDLAPKRDVVSLVQREFPALEANLKATVKLERQGSLSGVVVVRAVTVEATASASFQAKPGEDYVHTDIEVRFEDGQSKATFDIELLPTDATWLPTRWFLIELKEVVSGQATLGGPTCTRWSNRVVGPAGRVYIIQDDTFPSSIPEEKFKSEEVDLWVLYYYIKERVKARGKKFWKALAGYCYEPVHTVVVTPLIQSYLLDWAAEPQQGGSYERIILLACIQLLSTFFLRWGDYAQTNNRGRTGGCRQVHRIQLLSKLLMMDHAQQYRYPGSKWFYAALNNVESMVSECYWQIYNIAQSVLALILCLLVLLWKAWYKNITSGEELRLMNFLPAMSLLIILPVAVSMTLLRRKQLALYLEARMAGEEQWVELFAWLAENGHRIYCFGVSELAKIESMFTSKSKAFVTKHWSARDYTNDGRWITKWLGAGAYCIILCVASFQLFQARLHKTPEFKFSSGDCIVLIQVFDKFAKYMSKLISSFITMQRAAVSIRKVALLLEIPEHKRLLDQLKPADSSEAISTPLSQGQVVLQDQVSRDHIVLRDVAFRLPKTRVGLGPLGWLTPRAKDFEKLLPLGKVIYIVGGTESKRLSVLSLLANLVTPTSGDIMIPTSEWSIMLPSVAVDLPNLTVKEDFILSGATEDAACKLSQLFGLDPEEIHMRMPPGKACMQALARSLLRDPTVLLAVRPMSSTSPELRDNVMRLLLAWQACGGGKALVSLLGRNDASLDQLPLVAEDIHERRTLIIDGELVPHWLPPDRVHVFDVGEVFES